MLVVLCRCSSVVSAVGGFTSFVAEHATVQRELVAVCNCGAPFSASGRMMVAHCACINGCFHVLNELHGMCCALIDGLRVG